MFAIVVAEFNSIVEQAFVELCSRIFSREVRKFVRLKKVASFLMIYHHYPVSRLDVGLNIERRRHRGQTFANKILVRILSEV